MAQININWSAAKDPLKDIEWWASLLECFEFQREANGKIEYIARCPAHPDEHPSLVVIHDPHSTDHPVGYACRAGCPSKNILYFLRERAKRRGEEDQDPETAETMNPSFTFQSSQQAQPDGTSLFDVTQTPLWSLAGYCGVSYGWLKDHPALSLSEDVARGLVGFAFEGVVGQKQGGVAKTRKMPPTPDGDKKTDISWHNNRKPVPPLWPIPPRALPEEIAITEGETDCILARYWGFEAFALTLGGGVALDLSVMEELHRRGARQLLIFFDTDATGARCRDNLVRLCLETNITPVPVDLRLLSDPLLGGYKDLRDFRHMFAGEDGRAPAHQAIREVIKKSESVLDDVIPCFEDVYENRPADPGWLVDDMLTAGCVSIMVSKPGLGKTTILMSLAKEARDGGLLLDKEVRPHRILLCTEEGTRSLWKKRELFGSMRHVRLHSVDFEGMDDQAWPEQVRIMADVARRHGCSTIVIDTLFSFAVPEDEDKSAKVRPVFKQLRSLTRQGFAVLVTMHGRKSGGTGGDQIAGSVVIPGEADIAIELSAADDGEVAHRKISWVKSRLNPDIVGRPAMTITVDGDRLVIVDDGAGQKDRETRIADYLGQDNQWHTADEIASALSLDAAQVQGLLDLLHKRKTVQREKAEGKGSKLGAFRYRLPQPMNFDGIKIH